MTVTINTPTTATRTRTQTPSAYIKSEYAAKKVGEIFSVPLGSLKVYPDFNLRTSYKLESFVQFIKDNGASFPPIRLMWVDNELFIDEGHRRHAACIEAGLAADTPISVYIGEDQSPEERLSRQISSNNGEKYSFMDMVAVVKQLIQKYHKKQIGVATMIGVSQPEVSAMAKFFGYSNLLFAAIERDDIKYTRVLHLQKQGLNEAQILTLIAESKKPVDDTTENTAVIDTPVVVASTSVSDDTTTSVSDDTTVETPAQRKEKLEQLLDSHTANKKVAKVRGVKPVAKAGDHSITKTSASKLLTDFMSVATIIDNQDGTMSFIVSSTEAKSFQKGFLNI
jgi:hypothetical protein